jgi:hypothetical protein
MSNSAPLILYSRVAASRERHGDVVRRLAARDDDGPRAHATFAALETDDVMELTSMRSLDELSSVLADRVDVERSVHPWLAGEWRHEILGHVEDVIGGGAALISSNLIEMRHIEVPPPVYAEYRNWRERTIYQAVQRRPEIDDFRSYQSVLSARPGVMFIVGSSVDVDQYRDVYRSAEYVEILKEAGSRYIANGLAGLDCHIFLRKRASTALKAAAE